jgi:hypothetical protein
MTEKYGRSGVGLWPTGAIVTAYNVTALSRAGAELYTVNFTTAAAASSRADQDAR